MRFEFALVLVDLAALTLCLGDVRVEGDEPVVRQRKTADQQQRAIGAQALGFVARKAGGVGYAFGHQGVDVASAVFPTLGVIADEGLKRCARRAEMVGEVEQAQKAVVAGDEAQRVIEHGDPFVDVVERGRDHFAIALVADLFGVVASRREGVGHGAG